MGCDDASELERGERFSDRRAADAEALSELAFGGEAVPRMHPALTHGEHNLIGDLSRRATTDDRSDLRERVGVRRLRMT
jgi:hypothetical protein